MRMSVHSTTNAFLAALCATLTASVPLATPAPAAGALPLESSVAFDPFA